MNRFMNISVAALTAAGSMLATAAPAAAQGRAMGGGDRAMSTSRAIGHGPIGVARGGWSGGHGAWGGGWNGGGWRGGYPYRYGYGYGWGPAFAGLAIGAAIGSAYAHGPAYGYPYGGCLIWNPYYGQYFRTC